MNRATVANRGNLELIEELYQRWRHDRDSVDLSWRNFFEGYEVGLGAPPSTGAPPGEQISEEEQELRWDAGRAQAAVTRIIDAYREYGHFLADLDPLDLIQPPEDHELLDLEVYGLTDDDLDRVFYTRLFSNHRATLQEILDALKMTYCGAIGVEYMHIPNPKIRRWLQERMEPIRNQPQLDRRKKHRVILKLYEAELFETFLHTHYVGQKRFSLEGAETLIPLLDALIERGGAEGVEEAVFGMPHRGRLNVLANILHKPYGRIFGEFEGNQAEETVGGDGDVKYHLGSSGEHFTADGRSIHLSLTPNPSHLESVNPVIQGRVRAKQRARGDLQGKLVVPILIHGDAAFAGQGLVPETLNLSQLRGYSVGGTVHVVVNNQVGFTTAPDYARSTRYCTDMAKMLGVPIFHVNGDDPEAVVHVAEMAIDFRQSFGMDVVIDLVCYRRHGHNEGDEPRFTQPVMYKAIDGRPSVKVLYTKKLIQNGDLTQDEADTIAETFDDKMQSVYDEVHNHPWPRPAAPPKFGGPWAGLTRQYSWDPIATGVPLEILTAVTDAASRIPEEFHINPKIQRVLEPRPKTIRDPNGMLDWAFGEMLAYGTLVAQGTPVRLSGQDSRRGTFSHRHAVLTDALTGNTYMPLRHVSPEQADFSVWDSPLSEAAVLGFEYGVALDSPQLLVLWEAQFGDFSNGAQAIIDQYICSGESKWGRANGVVLLLPHGYEGQGPEHSSARLERFLQLYAEDNIQVVNASNPAQFFHLLRRQMLRNFRKPLIVMTPKSLLRRKEAVSPVSEFVSGRFREVIDDPVAPEKVRRVVFCSGKVYYDLAAHRASAGLEDRVALVRVEQIAPWPEEQVKAVRARFRNATEWVWAQEESQNMGAWTFVAPRLREALGSEIQYVGRDASASPATGSHKIHEAEQKELVEHAVGQAIPHIVTSTPLPHLSPALSVAGKE